jgi:hypothetical protein
MLPISIGHHWNDVWIFLSVFMVTLTDSDFSYKKPLALLSWEVYRQMPRKACDVPQ